MQEVAQCGPKHIEVHKEQAQPQVLPYDLVSRELDMLQDLSVFYLAVQVVPVPKPDGSIRLCKASIRTNPS